MTLDFSLMGSSIPFLLSGTLVTLEITIVSVLMGTLIGLVMGLCRCSKFKILVAISTAYIEFIRGTPLLVQLFLVHFGTPQLLDISMEAYMSAVIAMSINSGAYVAEIIRGGIQSIDNGQTEAGRSLGLTYMQTMLNIILPQAFRNVLPALGNEFIALLKDSSLVSVIALEELTRKGQLIIGRSYKPFEIWIMIAIFYLIMTMTLSRIVAYWERRNKIQHD